jgi:hypothetical protein
LQEKLMEEQDEFVRAMRTRTEEVVHENERLAGDLAARLGLLLADDEVAALRVRAAELLERGTHPEPRVPYPYPWPLR